MKTGDNEILERIKELSNEDWFKNGDDAPENIIEEFEDIESDNSDLDYLIELTTGGPGLTDVWISRGVLIGDVFSYGDGLEDGEEVTEDDIYNDNKIYFSENRELLLSEIIL
jgi:hypothetical protein